MGLVFFNVLGVILVTISIEWVAGEAINNVHYMGRQVGRAKEMAEKIFQVSSNKLKQPQKLFI